MRNIRIAKPYAQALFDAATEQQARDQIVTDAQKLVELAKTSSEFEQLITDPILSPEFKAETFQQVLSTSVHPLMLNFLLLLSSKQRERWLVQVLQAFLHLVDEKEGRMVAQVTSAIPMSEKQQADLVRQLSTYSGKEVRLELSEDASIKGGFIVRLGDTVFDGSVAAQLRRLKAVLSRG